MQNKKKKPASLLSLVLTIGISFAVFAYLGISINTSDPLWFLSVFAEIPEKIELHCRGELVTLLPDDEVFDTLYTTANEIISSPKNWLGIQMSEDTYDYFLTSKDVIVLELFYAEKVKIHSMSSYYKNIEQLVIPLFGRHSDSNVIFGINNGTPVSGAMNIELPTTPLLETVINHGLCSIE